MAQGRREHPRTSLGLQKSMIIHGEKRIPIFDISKGGASFLSDQQFEVGSFLIVGSGLLTIEVKVLECTVVEVDSGLLDYKYKVRCQYQTQDKTGGETFFEMVIQ